MRGGGKGEGKWGRGKGGKEKEERRRGKGEGEGEKEGEGGRKDTYQNGIVFDSQIPISIKLVTQCLAVLALINELSVVVIPEEILTPNYAKIGKNLSKKKKKLLRVKVNITP